MAVMAVMAVAAAMAVMAVMAVALIAVIAAMAVAMIAAMTMAAMAVMAVALVAVIAAMMVAMIAARSVVTFAWCWSKTAGKTEPTRVGLPSCSRGPHANLPKTRNPRNPGYLRNPGTLLELLGTLETPDILEPMGTAFLSGNWGGHHILYNVVASPERQSINGKKHISFFV